MAFKTGQNNDYELRRPIQLAILPTVQISGLRKIYFEIWLEEEAHVYSHFALLEALSEHSDDCYWVWVLNDTPFRLIRGDEAIVYWSQNDFPFLFGAPSCRPELVYMID